MPVSLAELLQEPVQSVIRRERDTLEELLRSRSNRVVLFGSGNLGRKAVGALQEIGVTPLAFSDNNQKRWGTALENTPILPPKEAAALYGSNAVFLVTIWNEFHWFCETKQQLTGYGCDSVIPYSFLHWRFPDTFLPCLLNDLPNKLYRERDLILKAADIWADPASRDLFEANIRLRALGEFDGIPGRSVENTYLPLDLIQLSASDRFLDCGATGGEMLRDLINKRGEEFALFCALEADNISFPTLETCRDSLSTNLQTKLRLYNCAVGAERQVVRFAHSGLTGSRISEEGLPVECFPIDDLFVDSHLTFIKMDIEGAEWDSLLATPDELLASIPQITMEMHGYDDPKIVEVLRKLKRNFFLVNLHFNNWSCTPRAAPLPAWAYQAHWVNKRIGVLDPDAPVPAPMSPLNVPDSPTWPDCQLPTTTSKP